MKKHEKRMVKEYWQLRKRIDKLESKIDKSVYDTEISDSQYRLLRSQFYIMCAYEGVLRERIVSSGIRL